MLVQRSESLAKPIKIVEKAPFSRIFQEGNFRSLRRISVEKARFSYSFLIEIRSKKRLFTSKLGESLVFSRCRMAASLLCHFDFDFHNGDLKTPKVDFVSKFDIKNSM